jgi:hypothetical protein
MDHFEGLARGRVALVGLSSARALASIVGASVKPDGPLITISPWAASPCASRRTARARELATSLQDARSEAYGPAEELLDVAADEADASVQMPQAPQLPELEVMAAEVANEPPKPLLTVPVLVEPGAVDVEPSHAAASATDRTVTAHPLERRSSPIPESYRISRRRVRTVERCVSYGFWVSSASVLPSGIPI